MGHAVPIEQLVNMSFAFFEGIFRRIFLESGLDRVLNKTTQSREMKMSCNPGAGSGIRLDLTGAGGRGIRAGLAMYIWLRHCFVSGLLLVIVFSVE